MVVGGLGGAERESVSACQGVREAEAEQMMMVVDGSCPVVG